MCKKVFMSGDKKDHSRGKFGPAQHPICNTANAYSGGNQEVKIPQHNLQRADVVRLFELELLPLVVILFKEARWEKVMEWSLCLFHISMTYEQL